MEGKLIRPIDLHGKVSPDVTLVHTFGERTFFKLAFYHSIDKGGVPDESLQRPLLTHSYVRFWRPTFAFWAPGLDVSGEEPPLFPSQPNQRSLKTGPQRWRGPGLTTSIAPHIDPGQTTCAGLQ